MTKNNSNEMAGTAPMMSFHVKYGWKYTRSGNLTDPNGLLLPVLCRKSICKRISILPARGTRKWREKNRDKVGLSTL